jgi:1,4-alpha-glucan branching enzyme
MGMGALPYDGGATFRVWAPNALGAAVTGDFTSWSAAGTPLAGETGGTGMWSADVPGARPGQAYQILLTTSAGTLTRVDPYARQVVSENGLATKAVIYDETAFDWGEGQLGQLRHHRRRPAAGRPAALRRGRARALHGHHLVARLSECYLSNRSEARPAAPR